MLHLFHIFTTLLYNYSRTSKCPLCSKRLLARHIGPLHLNEEDVTTYSECHSREIEEPRKSAEQNVDDAPIDQMVDNNEEISSVQNEDAKTERRSAHANASACSSNDASQITPTGQQTLALLLNSSIDSNQASRIQEVVRAVPILQPLNQSQSISDKLDHEDKENFASNGSCNNGNFEIIDVNLFVESQLIHFHIEFSGVKNIEKCRLQQSGILPKPKSNFVQKNGSKADHTTTSQNQRPLPNLLFIGNLNKSHNSNDQRTTAIASPSMSPSKSLVIVTKNVSASARVTQSSGQMKQGKYFLLQPQSRIFKFIYFQ